MTARRQLPGMTLFDGAQARKGYALNKMCSCVNEASNRSAFQADADGYRAKYGLNDGQRAAIRARNELQLIVAGGNVYTLAAFVGIFGLHVQDLGAALTLRLSDMEA